MRHLVFSNDHAKHRMTEKAIHTGSLLFSSPLYYEVVKEQLKLNWSWSLSRLINQLGHNQFGHRAGLRLDVLQDGIEMEST